MHLGKSEMYIHTKKPARRVVPTRTKYSEYRSDLELDFNGACGYCDDNNLRVDSVCFHIDHFAPKSLFPLLQNEYTNLVYSCRFCNQCKSSHWIGNDATIPHDGQKGFIDPCSNEYDQNLERDSYGRIRGKTELGRYIVRRLNLNLIRHELLWNARRARSLRDVIPTLTEKYEAAGLPNNAIYTSLLKRYMELTKQIESYELCAING